MQAQADITSRREADLQPCRRECRKKPVRPLAEQQSGSGIESLGAVDEALREQFQNLGRGLRSGGRKAGDHPAWAGPAGLRREVVTAGTPTGFEHRGPQLLLEPGPRPSVGPWHKSPASPT